MLQYLDLQLSSQSASFWLLEVPTQNCLTLPLYPLKLLALYSLPLYPELWWWYPWCDPIAVCPWWCLFWSLLPCKSLLGARRLLSLLILTLEGIIWLCARVLNNKYYRKQRGLHDTLKRFPSSWRYSELNVTLTPFYSLPLWYNLITPKYEARSLQEILLSRLFSVWKSIMNCYWLYAVMIC